DVAIHTEPGRPSLVQDHSAVIAVTNLRGQNTQATWVAEGYLGDLERKVAWSRAHQHLFA
ncbi:hypothetical protein ABZT48_40815, partial [Streptomyces avermitilis]